jgi:Fe-S oxidoreductase
VTELMPPQQATAARMCASCPKMCRSACPTQAVTGNERHQPWGHARQIVDAMRGDGGFVDAELVDGVYACATCSACTPPCHVDGVETPQLIWAARAAVHEAGGTPAMGVEAVRQARAGMVPATTAGQWTDPSATLDSLREMATPGADLLLVPGCGALGRRPSAVLATGRALRALDVAFDVPTQHACCGMVAQTFGDATAANTMRQQVLDNLQASGARRVAVQSPSCAFMLGGPAVEPLAATLARALAAHTRSTTLGEATRVAYHDPCYLARHQSCRDEPRAALAAAGYEVTELHRRGDTTQCSGQGGGLPLTHPDLAAGYLGLLVAEVERAGVGEVVTGCASCASALRGAGLHAAELSEAVAAALGV